MAGRPGSGIKLPKIGSVFERFFKSNKIQVGGELNLGVLPEGIPKLSINDSPAVLALNLTLQKLGLNIGDVVIEFRSRMESYPKIKDKIIPLAQRGWFLSGALLARDLQDLADVCGELTEIELDARVAELYRGDIEDQMNGIISAYPNREFVLKPALAAHLRGEYAISVPIFYAQVDGIAFEKSGRYIFFGGDKLRTKAIEELKNIESSEQPDRALLETMMWLPLRDSLPIGYGKDQRKSNNYSGLNRNTVLHGIALGEYATEVNSLKAFSMLSYIASLIVKK